MGVEIFVVSGGRVGRVASSLHDVASNSGFTVAFGVGELQGEPIAAALAADWFTITPDAVLQFDSAAAWSGAAIRLGGKVLRLYLLESARFDAAAALRHELCDAIAERDETGEQWFARWMARRNPIALESAAALIRLRGGDRLERAEFGRLFAAGGPQAGLRAFLERKSR